MTSEYAENRFVNSLPQGWRVVKLSEVAEQCLGKMLDAKKNKGRPFFYLRNPDVRWFDIDVSDLREMPFEDHELERFELKSGDVVICEGGEAGRAAIWDERLPDIKFQKALHRVRPGPELFNRYLVYRLLADYKSGRLAEYYTGVTIKHLTGRDLSNYSFELPPIAEQYKIVAVFDQVDSLRNMCRSAIAQLELLSGSIFFELFGDLVVNDKNWDDTKILGDCSEVVSGFTKGRKLDGKSTSAVPYLTVANVQDKFLKLEGVRSDEATALELERYRLKKGDLLLTEGGDPDKLGRGTLWNDELPICIHQNHVFRVRLVTNELTPVFLNWLVGSSRGKRYFLTAAKQTTGIASINISQLKKFPLVIPPLALQKKFGLFIAEIERVKNLQKKHLSELDALFASLQHRAFRGEL